MKNIFNKIFRNNRLYQTPFSQNKDTDQDIVNLYNNGVISLSNSNYNEAVIYFQKAAEQGHTSAAYNLSLIIGAGLVNPFDIDKAIEYLQKAAIKEHPIAQKYFSIIEEANKGNCDIETLIQIIQQSIPQNDIYVSAFLMMLSCRYFYVLCEKFNVLKPVLSYELSAMSKSEKPFIRQLIQKMGISSNFYKKDENLKEESLEDQVTNQINFFSFALKRSGYNPTACLFARLNIIAYIVFKSDYGNNNICLISVDNFTKV